MNYRHRNPWAVKVHADLLASGERLTAEQVEERFGRPAGNTCVALRMANAVKGGWFLAVPAEPGSRFKVYVPVDKAQGLRVGQPERIKPPNLDFIGRDFPRVRSVFELSEAFA